MDAHSTISWPTVTGQNYYVLVHGSQAENVGDFGLQVTVVEPLPGTNSNHGDKSTSATPLSSRSLLSILFISTGILTMSL